MGALLSSGFMLIFNSWGLFVKRIFEFSIETLWENLKHVRASFWPLEKFEKYFSDVLLLLFCLLCSTNVSVWA